ncbi:MAG: hypothetical protein J6B72_01490 [Clostridia bacterium]|nr:hypothetical protein [Clostridia bacterium]
MKMKLKYLAVALSVVMMLSLLAACGEQTKKEDGTTEFVSDTDDADGFETVNDDKTSDEVDESDTEKTKSDSSASSGDDEKAESEQTGKSDGTVDLPILPL